MHHPVKTSKLAISVISCDDYTPLSCFQGDARPFENHMKQINPHQLQPHAPPAPIRPNSLVQKYPARPAQGQT
jgi:hypothetical protein